MESTKEKLEKSIKRLNSLVETASKCGDNGLVREAKSKLALYNSILLDLERLEKLENENKQLKAKLDRSLPKIVIRNTLDNILPSLEEENEKLKQVIEILKRFNFEYQFDCYYLVANDRTAIKATLEELQLVKEVLENDK